MPDNRSPLPRVPGGRRRERRSHMHDESRASETAVWAAAEGIATAEQLALLEADPRALAAHARAAARRHRGQPRRGPPARRARARPGGRRLRGRARPPRGGLRPADPGRRPGRAPSPAPTRPARSGSRRRGRPARSWCGRPGPDAAPGRQRRAGRPPRGHRRPGARAGACTPTCRCPTGARAAALSIPVAEALGWLVAVGGGLGRDGVGASVAWLGRVAVAAVRLVARGAVVPDPARHQAPRRPSRSTWPCAGCRRCVDDGRARPRSPAAMPGPVTALAAGRRPGRHPRRARRRRRRHRRARPPAGSSCRRRRRSPAPPPPSPRRSSPGSTARPSRRRSPPAPRCPSGSSAGPSRSTGAGRTRLVVQLDPPDTGDAWFLSVLGPGAEGGLLPDRGGARRQQGHQAAGRRAGPARAPPARAAAAGRRCAGARCT